MVEPKAQVEWHSQQFLLVYLKCRISYKISVKLRTIEQSADCQNCINGLTIRI